MLQATLFPSDVLGAQAQSVLYGGELLWLIVGWLFIILFWLYVLFAFVVTRQIRIMRKTLITPFAPVLTLLGYAHLAVALLAALFFTIGL